VETNSRTSPITPIFWECRKVIISTLPVILSGTAPRKILLLPRQKIAIKGGFYYGEIPIRAALLVQVPWVISYKTGIILRVNLN